MEISNRKGIDRFLTRFCDCYQGEEVWILGWVTTGESRREKEGRSQGTYHLTPWSSL